MAYPMYNPYQPMYQPMQDQLGQLRQPYMQPAQPQNNGITWVQGEEGAKGYLETAGDSKLLMDSEKSVFYIKSTDQSGMPMPLRIFDYKERTAQKPQAQPSTEYVTRAEFEAALAALAKKEVEDAKPSV